MLVITQLVKTPSVERLTKLWAKRYTPDLSSRFLFQDPWLHRDLVEAASPAGRVKTVAKLQLPLLDVTCQMAGILAKELYEYIPNVLDLNETRQLSQYSHQVYIKLLEFYQQSSNSQQSILWAIAGNSLSLSEWGIPNIEQLATALQPILLEFQEQHILSHDWRTLGFITTLLNFCNQLLLKQLTPIEQIIIAPYFKFVEEQVAVPWQRVCAAAAKHQLDSPALALVEQMLSVSDEIAQVVYHRITELFPNHRSRRGGLSDPGVTHSCLRDLNMFQAYLWLCMLEENTVPMEQELAALCIMVMESVDVKWELCAQWIQSLVDEIMSRVTPEQSSLLQPHTQAMQEIFFEKRQRLGAILQFEK
ncbi:MAG: hypothetical protein KME30_19125 [Iphinoe sp. HA4291-MV1]|nr:hypothetical protein [Iphinoe sp. HA4291-MV1]